MRMRACVFVVPLLVLELAACGQPEVVVEVVGRAVPAPARTGAPGLGWLGETPVAPEVVRL